jgi:hypothetical protein
MKTLAVICFLAVVGFASCQTTVTCINCNSTTSSQCADPYTSANNQTLISNGATCTGVACQILRVTSGGTTVVSRSCLYVAYPNYCGAAGLPGVSATVCTCFSSNYCNGARPSVVPGIVTAAFLAAVALVLIKI